MKKFLLVLLSLFMIAGIAGCGPSAKDEAKQFNDTYYVKGYQKGIFAEANAMEEKLFEQYGDSYELDEAFAKTDIPKKVAAYLDTVKNVKIQNKEVEPLKERLVIYLEAYNSFVGGIGIKENDVLLDIVKNSPKLKFDYRNEYSKITTGKGLPVINTSNGQYYATVASNVSFAITDVKESETAGKGYWVKKAQGKFIAVKIFIYNNQKDAITIDSNSFHLVDKEGRQFSASTEGMSAIQISEGHTKGFLTQLNPTMSIETTFVFDVPANAKPDDYELEAHGGFTGDKVKMPLSVEKTGY